MKNTPCQIWSPQPLKAQSTPLYLANLRLKLSYRIVVALIASKSRFRIGWGTAEIGNAFKRWISRINSVVPLALYNKNKKHQKIKLWGKCIIQMEKCRYERTGRERGRSRMLAPRAISDPLLVRIVVVFAKRIQIVSFRFSIRQECSVRWTVCYDTCWMSARLESVLDIPKIAISEYIIQGISSKKSSGE